MRALVTGANGLIGAALVRELIANGHEAVAMVRPNGDLRALQGLGVTCRQGDILQPDSLRGAFEGCQTVFHTAAIFSYWGHSQESLENTAVSGTRHVLEAAAVAGVRRVVLTSSSVVFGSNLRPCLRNEADAFDDPAATIYAMSKYRQKESAARWALSLGLELITACPTLVLGPNGGRLGTSNAILANYLNDPSRSSFLGGCNVVAAHDVARGHRLLAERGVPGEDYLLGGENLSWVELHRTISDLCLLTGPWITLNHTSAFLLAAAAQAYARFSDTAPTVTIEQARMVGRFYWYDHGKASNLGYQPSGARAAIAETLRWLVTTDYVNRFVRAVIQPLNTITETLVPKER